MKFIIKRIFITILIVFILFLPVLSLAKESTTINNPIKGVDTVDGFIAVILIGVIKIALPIVALAIIYSGFLFVTARGKPEELNKAKAALLYSVIGAAILLGAWALAQLISDTVLKLG